MRGGPARALRALAAVLLAVSGAAAGPAASSVADDFEGAALGPLWRTDKVVAGGVVLQRDVVRSGRQAVRFEVREGDVAGTGSDGEPTERAELQEADVLRARFGHAYEYRFSMFVPPDFPIVHTRLVLAQWKQLCPGPCDRSPVVAQRFVDGVLSVTVEGDAGRTTIYRHPRPIAGEWVDLRYRIRFSREADGAVTVWIGGQEVATHRGPLGYAADRPEVYFKFGLYRDRLRRAMSVYFDAYRKEALPE